MNDSLKFSVFGVERTVLKENGLWVFPELSGIGTHQPVPDIRNATKSDAADFVAHLVSVMLNEHDIDTTEREQLHAVAAGVEAAASDWRLAGAWPSIKNPTVLQRFGWVQAIAHRRTFLMLDEWAERPDAPDHEDRSLHDLWLSIDTETFGNVANAELLLVDHPVYYFGADGKLIDRYASLAWTHRTIFDHNRLGEDWVESILWIAMHLLATSDDDSLIKARAGRHLDEQAHFPSSGVDKMLDHMITALLGDTPQPDNELSPAARAVLEIARRDPSTSELAACLQRRLTQYRQASELVSAAAATLLGGQQDEGHS